MPKRQRGRLEIPNRCEPHPKTSHNNRAALITPTPPLTVARTQQKRILSYQLNKAERLVSLSAIAYLNNRTRITKIMT